MQYDRPTPKPGETWRHWEGSLCYVLHVPEYGAYANASAAFPMCPAVVYQCSKAEGRVFYRPMDEWMASIPSAGVNRYELAPPPAEGTECSLCDAPATMWDGLQPSCEVCAYRVPF